MGLRVNRFRDPREVHARRFWIDVPELRADPYIYQARAEISEYGSGGPRISSMKRHFCSELLHNGVARP